MVSKEQIACENLPIEVIEILLTVYKIDEIKILSNKYMVSEHIKILNSNLTDTIKLRKMQELTLNRFNFGLNVGQAFHTKLDRDILDKIYYYDA